MDKNGMLIVFILMLIATIGMVIWYLRAGYSHKHTIDELPDQEDKRKME